MQLLDARLPFPGPLGLVDEDWERIAHLFNGHPRRREDWRERSRWLDVHYGGDRQALADALADYNRRIGAGEKAFAALARFRSQGALAVVTGQQAGLLTGPLYTIHKALTAVALARTMGKELGRPVVPFFWIASEDHDWSEVDHTWVPGKDKAVKIHLEGSPAGRIPVGARPMPPGWEEVVDALAALIPSGPYREEMLEGIRERGRASANPAEWFARLMAWLFWDTELVFVDPLEPALKDLGKTILARCAADPEGLRRALEKGTSALREQGFEPPVKGEEGACHLFALQDGERVALFFRGGSLVDRSGTVIGTLEGLSGEILKNPGGYSPNVVTRPLLQDWLLPTMAYVAGPSEGAYLAQYKEVYRHVGMEMPLVFPRASLSLLDAGLASSLKRYGVTGQRPILDGLEKEERENLARNDSLGLDGLFAGVKEGITTTYETLFEPLERLDPHLRPLIVENRDRVLHQVDYLAQTAWQKHRQKSEGIIRDFRRMRLHLAPRGGLQERTYNVFPYLFRNGLPLIRGLVQLPLAEAAGHHWVLLDAE